MDRYFIIFLYNRAMEGKLIKQKLFLLGSPRLEQDGVTIRIGRRKSMALLAYLAVTGQPQNRDALLPLLWPENDTATARVNLRRDLSYLRKQVGAEPIPGDRQQLRFEPDAGVWVDVLAFRALLAEKAAYSDSTETPSSLNLDQVEQAVALASGDFMAGFGLDEASAYDDWQYFQASALRHELTTALKAIIAAHTAAGRFDDALTHARRWLALDSLHEPAQRELMQLLAWSGQTSAALAQFAASKQLLRDELGVEPAKATLALVEAIRTHTLPPPGTPAADPLTVPMPPRKRHNLPAQLTPFVGREQELAALAGLLADPAGRLITILGPGGMGKSRLALAAAEWQRAMDRFPAGVFWLPLAPLSEPGHIIPALAAALDFPLQAEDAAGRSAQKQLLDYLSDKQILLLLDNFEHLLAGAALLNEILAAAPSVAILTTSRERLRLQAEQMFLLSGLTVPADPDAGADHPAAQLFLQAARRVVRDFDPVPTGDLPALNQICRLVEGMPLALELAAAWVNLLTLPEIVTEIQGRLDFLATDARDRPVRQRSIQAVFASAWARLTPDEQHVFARLSVCRGGFSRAAAQAIGGAGLRDLSNFCDRALLSFDQASRRYTCHELLRQFAAEQLVAVGEAENAAAAHANYFLTAMAARTEALEGPDQLQAIHEIAADFENVRLAWNWAVARRKFSILGPMLDALGTFLRWQGQSQDGCSAIRTASGPTR